MTTLHTPAPGRTTDRASRRYAGAILIAEGVLAFAPLAILAPAIGWPASLGEPAGVQLAAIAAEADVVRLGYSVYLLYSLAILPAMALLAQHALGKRASTALIATIIGFAAASALARCIGILRWLTAMPLLAQDHAIADAADRPQIERLFGAISEYGGGIGEVLGVSVFMAAAMLCLSLPAWRSRSMPRILSGAGIAVALCLAALSLPAFGYADLMPIAAAVTALSVWQTSMGVWLMLPVPAAADDDAAR